MPGTLRTEHQEDAEALGMGDVIPKDPGTTQKQNLLFPQAQGRVIALVVAA